MNNIVAYCALLTAVLATAVAAYDFSDSAFNQILANKLDDLYSSWDNSISKVRNRRAADEKEEHEKECEPHPPPKGPRPLCCAGAVFDTMDLQTRDLMRECFRETKESEHAGERPEGRPDPFNCGPHRRHMVCVTQCTSQKKNLVDAEGNPKEKEMMAYVKDAFKDVSWFASVQDEVISKCLKKANNITADDPDEACNPAALRANHCLFREVQLSCPDDEIKDKENCNKLREKLQEDKHHKHWD